MQEITRIIGFIGIGSACLPILCVLIEYFSNGKKYLFITISYLAFFYAFFNLLVLFIFLYLPEYQGISINLYSIVEFVLILMFYLKILQKNYVRLILIFLIPTYIALLINSILFSDINENYLTLNIFQKTTLLVFSLLYLNKVYKSNSYDKLYKSPYFWINTAILLYNASTIYISVFENILRNDKVQIFYILWPILQISGIAYYVLFSIGIWKLKD